METCKKISELTDAELLGRVIKIENPTNELRLKVTKVTKTQIQCGSYKFNRRSGNETPKQRWGWHISNF